MGKVPRGAAFIPAPEKQVKKRRTDQQPAKPVGAVVFFGGRQATLFGKGAGDAAAEAAPEPVPAVTDAEVLSQVAAVSDSVLFNPASYRMWSRDEVLELDGDIRKGLKEEERLLQRSSATLRRAAKDARRYQEAGPLNKAITDHGSDKQYGFAQKALDLLRKITSPTVYTLAGIVNACVRCGDIDAALKYFYNAESDWGITPNEVVVTTLMKGLCGEGRQREATTLLLSMKKAYGVEPNERMAATLMRGCMRNTDGRSALLTSAKLSETGIAITANPSAVEYCVKALSYDGMLEEGAKYLAEHNDKVNHAACVALATACVLAGDSDLAKAAVSSAKAQLERSKSEMRASFMHPTEPTPSSGKGGKPGKKGGKGGKGGKGNRSQSAAMFNRLRDSEVNAEIDRLENVLSGVTPIAAAPTMRDGGKPCRTYKQDPMVVMLPQDTLDLSHYFKDMSLPLRVEVCSGHGEWVVDRASSEMGRANWIGVEIRPDRVYQAWTKRRLLGKEAEPRDNLLLMCGDAREAVRLLRGAGVHDLFINYPEPPGWMGSKSNLLDAPFFEGIHETLATGGAVTMVSDHPLYSAHTSLGLVRLSRRGLFYSSLTPGNGVPISTDIPANYGSSYFDRMWLNGARRKRFFIHFIKSTPAIATVLSGMVGAADNDLGMAGEADMDDDAFDDDYDAGWGPAEADGGGDGHPTRRRIVLL